LSTFKTPYQRSYWVSPGKLLAGYYPGSSTTNAAASKLEGLVESGIRHVVNLMEEAESNRHGEPFVPYQAPFSRRGISFARMPIKDMQIPSREQMIAILDEVDRSIAAGAPTYVHCWGGKGRTGTVVGCWLVRHGMAQPERALERIKELQALCGGQLSPSPENEPQRDFVRGWKAGQ